MNNEALIAIQSRIKISPYGKQYILLEEFTYEIGFKGSGKKITVPKGFIFDGASIPKVFWSIPFMGTPMDTDTLPAALIHDFLYKTHKKTRLECDDIFYDVMENTNVFLIKRINYYLGVRSGGWVTRYYTGEYVKNKLKK